MRHFDFSPLYRSSVGFDRLASMLDQVSSMEQKQPSYPPYNIERIDEDQYRISMAVAGFDASELDAQTENATLTVKGSKAAKDGEEREFLHRGIGTRDFELRFQLDDHVKVVGADLKNGLLNIDLAREIPEAMKPRSIAINSGDGSHAKVIDAAESAPKLETEQQQAA